MARIKGFRIKNFKALKDITLGRLWNSQSEQPLTPLTVIIGSNGVGKSTLIDAFGFLSDCLQYGVEEACDLKGRGGFERLCSQGSDETIEFEIYFQEDTNSRPITYELSISLDENGHPFVSKERLRQRRKNQKRGWPYSFLILENGKGRVWKGESEGINEQLPETSSLPEESNDWELVELDDPQRLGIATLGQLRQHPRISSFRKFLENWYLSYFVPDSARSLPLAGPQKHLNVHGDNLGNVVQFLERNFPSDFSIILSEISRKITGIQTIQTEKSPDGRLLLKFICEGFDEPFYAQQMSDGTLKLFAYLILLNDPAPPPFLCIEEPENGLYHKLLSDLACEFREHASKTKDGAQMLVTTHQPYFVDSLSPEEVWVLEKGKDGFSRIHRASDDPIVNALYAEELPLGGLWFSNYLERNPKHAL